MFRSFWYSAWGLLVAANLFWAGNIVLARGLAGQVPPVTLAYWRWTGAFVVAVGFAWPRLKTDLPVMMRHWKMMLMLSATGIASYSTMSYIGLTSTTALNVLLLQSATPLIIIVWAYLLFRETPTARQTVGVLVSLAGVAAIACHGSMDMLAHLRLNHGDLWVLSGLLIYAFYCVTAAQASTGASAELPGRRHGDRIPDDAAVHAVANSPPVQGSSAGCHPIWGSPTPPCCRRSSPICFSTAASS